MLQLGYQGSVKVKVRHFYSYVALPIVKKTMSGFHCQFCKGSLMKVHYPKLYNMALLLALNVLLLPKDLTITFIQMN